MHWVLDSTDPAGVPEARRQVDAYLRRHGEPNSDFDGAALIVSELLTNAVLHAPGPSWLWLEWSQPQPRIRVMDLGPGFDMATDLPDDPRTMGGRGLFLVNHFAGELQMRRRRAAGTEMEALLPVWRAPSESIDPPRRRIGALPELEEALPSGGFGRESFLRALVVQLARVVGEQQGPAAAEAAVAQVGTDVGGQMEAEYRQAKDIAGRLSAEQVGECLVRLKHAIDGNFWVTEASDQRIVLENSRCPFGEAVRRAPALCRMTSAVFGGIAARNSDVGVDVTLEERIALGDPGCRVVIDLVPPPDPAPWTHRYRIPQ